MKGINPSRSYTKQFGQERRERCDLKGRRDTACYVVLGYHVCGTHRRRALCSVQYL